MKQSNELQVRFTAWMHTLVRRARVDFIRQQQRQIKTISFEDIDNPDELLQETGFEEQLAQVNGEFTFENERMGQAFAKLSLTRRKILMLTFVDGFQPDEIARLLGCSVQNVYNERSIALKKLHEFMTKE